MARGRTKGITKSGGRQKGTPNRVTSDTKQWIKELVDGNRGVFEADLKIIEPDKRLSILEKMMAYIVPKLSSVDVKTQINAEYEALEKLLKNAPDEAIEKITQKVVELKEISKQA